MGIVDPSRGMISQNLEILRIPRIRGVRKILNVGIAKRWDTIKMSARLSKRIRIVTTKPMQMFY